MRRIFKGIAILIAVGALAAIGAVVWFDYNYSPSRVVEYARIGDLSLELSLFEPAEDNSGALRPATLFFHGGGWRSGLPAQMFNTAKLLAENGYVAASASYRLKYSDDATPFDCVDDAKRAYRWLWDHAGELRIDRRRIVVGGSSAGGHLAAAVALIPRPTDPPDSPAAMLLFNAALDTSFEKPTDARIRMLEDEFENRGREISPTNHVRPGAAPAIVFHGMKDGLVPFQHAVEFCDQMKQAGNSCELVGYPEAGHGFYNVGLPLVEDANSKLLAFLERRQITKPAKGS